MEKISLILSFLLVGAGIFKLDFFLIPTLDYFGKYVFFVMINIFVFWVCYQFFRYFKGTLRIVMPLLYGLIICLLGVKGV